MKLRPALLRRSRSVIVVASAAIGLAGCKPANRFVAPPLAEISVALPLRQAVTPYIVLTGNTQAINSVDLVARVEGFLQSIDYKDGQAVKKDDLLFRIDPTTYQVKVQQAQAELVSAKAQLLNAEAEFARQESLLRQNVTAQNTYDLAKAKRDSAQGSVDSQMANLAISHVNLGYTKVLAPFDGVATAHLMSVGELVGSAGPTKLATIVQLDPIYVTFNLSEQDLLRVRGPSGIGGLKPDDLAKIPLEIRLMNEQGFPHKGVIDYASPSINADTGTVMMRGLFANPDRKLLPGFFVRIRLPTGEQTKDALIVPDRVLSEDQAGKYLLVVNKSDEVEQRRVNAGILLTGGLRAIVDGLDSNERVVLSTNGRAVPGAKVTPKLTTLQALPAH